MKTQYLINFNTRSLLLAAIILFGATVPATPPRAAENGEMVVEQPIPTDTTGFYYVIGGGTPLPKPASFSQTARIKASWRLGAGYSCGSFDPFQNVEAMMNQVLNKIRRLPAQFMGAVQAGIAALPGYLLAKANPTLYENLTKVLDDSFELFNTSFKSCQQMERETARKQNPYHEFVRASIAGNWRNIIIGSDGAQTIDQIEEEVNTEGPRNGIDFVDGAKRGGVGQPPIRVNYDITVTGYNSLLGKTTELLSEEPPVDPTLNLPDGTRLTIPMVRMFSSPKKAAEWLVEVVGEHEVRLATEEEKQSEVTSKPGRGLMPEVEMHTVKIRQALEKAILNNDYGDLREYRDVLQIGFMLVDAIRQAQPFEQSIMLDRLASELATNFVQNKVVMIKRMLYAGIKEANIGMSDAAAPIEKQIREHTIIDLDKSMREIHDALDLKLKTVARTTSQILRYGEYMSTRRAGDSGVKTIIEDQLIDGAVHK